jgi:anti-sigma-K factor RskA
MIDEIQQDRAIAYLLGNIPPAEAANFENELRRNPELATFAQELREGLSLMAQSLPPQTPPAGLRQKVLAAAQSQASGPRPASITAFPRRYLWIAALAAALVFAFARIGLDDLNVRNSVLKKTADNLALRTELESLTKVVASLEEQTSAQKTQIAELEKRDSLAEVKIATLSAQVSTYEKAGVVVVWDEAKQQGIIKLVNMPKADLGKDYQLWIIDPKYPNPVNGGIVAINNETTTVATFKPDQLVSSANAFAISVEKTGGVPKAEGPIVLVGN